MTGNGIWLELNDHLFNIEKIAGISLDYCNERKMNEIVIHFPDSTYSAHYGSREECEAIMNRIRHMIPVTHKIKVSK